MWRVCNIVRKEGAGRSEEMLVDYAAGKYLNTTVPDYEGLQGIEHDLFDYLKEIRKGDETLCGVYIHLTELAYRGQDRCWLIIGSQYLCIVKQKN